MMQSFSKNIESIERRVRRCDRLLMLFDFDGTLAPIVEHPNDARMAPGWRDRLAALVRHRRITAGIVTGRVIADIRRRVSVPGLVLSVNHGFEIWRGNRCLLRRGVRFRKAMKAYRRIVTAALKNVHGVVIENKAYSVAVHYRMVASGEKAAVRRTTMQLAAPFVEHHGGQLLRGKQVLELRSNDDWNKGHAALWIRDHLASGALPFYVGDDTTDEDAFRALGRRGITVRVGRRKDSAAQYVVRDIEEIVPLVEWILCEW